MMSHRIKIITLFVLVVFLLTACVPVNNTTAELIKNDIAISTDEEMISEGSVLSEPVPTDESESFEEVLTNEAGDEEQVSTMDLPTWFEVSLTDVRTGQTFTIKDHLGKVVLVETLAMWCSSCLRQQVQVKELHEKLSAQDQFVSVGLDIDVNEQAQDLKAYTDTHGFDWLYAIAPAEVALEISELYGAQFLNPSSTPILVIDANGEVHLTPFGVKSADELYDFISPLLAETSG